MSPPKHSTAAAPDPAETTGELAEAVQGLATAAEAMAAAKAGNGKSALSSPVAVAALVLLGLTGSGSGLAALFGGRTADAGPSRAEFDTLKASAEQTARDLAAATGIMHRLEVQGAAVDERLKAADKRTEDLFRALDRLEDLRADVARRPTRRAAVPSPDPGGGP